ncbi:hypothetical protein L2E82_02194 [Cichorium intybus]|uniref:Uncharacterized protein n=1 Tax=Cichorium intybus TaxID=13427 RepID=A0ACB9H228_CICIN|nr:hypothetical protein L2E82_02194 [Cichorium intybus]
MAMANLLLKPPMTMIAPKPMITLNPIELPPSDLKIKRCLSYASPTSSSMRPLSLRPSSKHAAAPVTPLLKGFGGNKNSSAFWALSFWDDLVQTDEKFLCPREVKEDSTVAETENVVAIFIFVLPNPQASRCILDPELLSRSMEIFFGALSACPMNEMLEGACTLISIWRMWDYLSTKINKKKRERKPSKKQSVTFDDVEGVDAAKAELLEIVLCIKGDSKYKKLGAKSPRGVLLAGPPGTGKTLLARAVAGEADVAFFSISASEFVEVFVGTGAARVRDLFRKAREHSPSIIFIDEIDAVGGERGKTLNCERDQTLNQLLTEMDGFEKDGKVVVIAATNRPESLDSALMRPGRFSRKVFVGEPDEDGRRKIFGLYMKEVPMEEDKHVICDLVASRTPGLVGADLENIALESLLLAARRDGDFVTKDDVLQAVERATTKITKAKSPYLFGKMALERVLCGGGYMGY